MCRTTGFIRISGSSPGRSWIFSTKRFTGNGRGPRRPSRTASGSSRMMNTNLLGSIGAPIELRCASLGTGERRSADPNGPLCSGPRARLRTRPRPGQPRSGPASAPGSDRDVASASPNISPGFRTPGTRRGRSFRASRTHRTSAGSTFRKSVDFGTRSLTGPFVRPRLGKREFRRPVNHRHNRPAVAGTHDRVHLPVPHTDLPSTVAGRSEMPTRPGITPRPAPLRPRRLRLLPRRRKHRNRPPPPTRSAHMRRYIQVALTFTRPPDGQPGRGLRRAPPEGGTLLHRLPVRRRHPP